MCGECGCKSNHLEQGVCPVCMPALVRSWQLMDLAAIDWDC